MKKKWNSLAAFALSFVLFASVISPLQVLAAQAETAASIVDPYVIFVPVKGETMKGLFRVQAPQDADIIREKSKIIATYTQGTTKLTKELDSIDGYYFGGWYATQDESVAIKYVSHKDEIENDATVYAKFVPSYMLNVKVQNSSSLDTRNGAWEAGYEDSEKFDSDNKTSIRMISAVDSTRYKEVGFHVYVNGKKVSKIKESRYNETVYESIIASGQTKTANDMFGLPGKLMIAKFINIPENGWKTSIYIRPYWVTFDGIEVRGNGRYAHVEDGIKRYISVPVNIQGILDSGSTGYAAGTLNVKYDSSKLNYIGAKGNGMLLETVLAHKTTDGIINCGAIGATNKDINNVIPNQESAVLKKNSDAEFTDADYFKINNMYITLRFQLKDDVTIAKGDFLTFNIENMDFCNVKEETVSINIWDVRY